MEFAVVYFAFASGFFAREFIYITPSLRRTNLWSIGEVAVASALWPLVLIAYISAQTGQRR